MPDDLLPAFRDPAYCDNSLDRAALRRDDAPWLSEQQNRPDAAYILISGDRPVVRIRGNALSIRHPRALAENLGIAADEIALLGVEKPERGARPVFCARVRAAAEEIEADIEAASKSALKLIDMRSLALQATLPAGDLGLLAQARSLCHWHESHGFCSRCGHKTRMAQAGYRRDCPSCSTTHFPRTDPVVIMLIADGDKALMGRPHRLAEGVYTTLAGFMEPGETIEQAVRREVMEEAGIRVGDVSFVKNQPWPFPASLMLGCFGVAESREINLGDDELEDCRWFGREEVREMLAGRHRDGLVVPPPISIAHWLIRSWIEQET
ncbi:NAD+ diphosphatase [Breoghania corrubedonensis]|uniref:NAD(+) diphosphatase n=1 Tax=Breoghania corrubedonensis TaxID=665038 RepID=A0A2T5VH64_9HYPH|nr:NAD(+) diphosphatase [Breoghania corrubedonensis]PTW63093.1 NAD+ diphosphatase [Breoghania corrubedonensis]